MSKPARTAEQARPAEPDRPEKLKLIGVHVTPEQHRAMNKVARTTGASVAFQVRAAVAEYLARRQDQTGAATS